jgi:hypothetical protein
MTAGTKAIKERPIELRKAERAREKCVNWSAESGVVLIKKTSAPIARPPPWLSTLSAVHAEIITAAGRPVF